MSSCLREALGADEVESADSCWELRGSVPALHINPLGTLISAEGQCRGGLTQLHLRDELRRNDFIRLPLAPEKQS